MEILKTEMNVGDLRWVMIRYKSATGAVCVNAQGIVIATAPVFRWLRGWTLERLYENLDCEDVE